MTMKYTMVIADDEPVVLNSQDFIKAIRKTLEGML